jgi:type II secretory pathway pseudopilin PulG
MIWPSDMTRRRSASRGFTLIEVMVAFALTAFVMSVVLVILPSSSVAQADRLRRLHAQEFAFSVLEEYRATYPVMAAKGEDPTGWSWSVSERDVKPNPPGSLDGVISYVEATATVWHRDTPEVRVASTGLIARPLP